MFIMIIMNNFSLNTFWLIKFIYIFHYFLIIFGLINLYFLFKQICFSFERPISLFASTTQIVINDLQPDTVYNLKVFAIRNAQTMIDYDEPDSSQFVQVQFRTQIASKFLNLLSFWRWWYELLSRFKPPASSIFIIGSKSN